MSFRVTLSLRTEMTKNAYITETKNTVVQLTQDDSKIELN